MTAERVIVLSWFQNLFQKLKKDEEEEFAESFFHNDKQGDLSPLQQYDGAKDVEVKVSYQYPKSSPLPPELLLKTTPEGRHKGKKARHSEKRKTDQVDDLYDKHVFPKEETRLIKANSSFHPTEIPSPVFGFRRPRKKTDIVEHELSPFFQADLSPLPENKELATEVVEREKEQQESSPVTQCVEETSISLENTSEQVKMERDAENTYELPAANKEKAAEANGRLQENSSEPLLKEENIDKRRSARSARQHLPFNVLMLKQDKEKRGMHKRINKIEPKQEHTNQPGEAEKAAKSFGQIEEEKEPAGETNLPGHYQFPDVKLLKPPIAKGNDTEWMMQQEKLLNQTLENFNVGASVVNVTQGPSVTRFEVQPQPGVKVNKITNLSDDIKLSLAARDIRIEAPIPGKHTIGIEVPNQTARPVFISEIIQSRTFRETASPLTVVLGLDIAGNPIVTDLKKMPHGLIAGATGSGKSVCINSIIISLLYKAAPEDLRLLLIDPKMVELAPYNRIPHLVSPVITDVKAATAALKWAVEEMERRYELFAHTGVRDINRFNELAVEHKQYSDKLPYIVIIIDELADLMMMSPADVEEAICRIAQKARACGIHLIIATQRPSVDVITGLIKANVPTRIAFSVSSQVDSRTIIDISGAEKLLGRGDMLFLENGSSKPVRLQGTFVSDNEIDQVVDHVKEQREPEYLFEQEELLKKSQLAEGEDELFFEACEFIVDQQAASTSSLQRRFKIGYNRAARLMDMLEQNGYITSANGSKPREVLITQTDLEMIQDLNG
jgi:S-DNA-T family DNA segregation ATPase FtsK/SpoIIIE